jgi:hypothetical protein
MFEVGRRCRCTMRLDCGQLDLGVVILPVPSKWSPRMPERLDEEKLAAWPQCGLSQLAAWRSVRNSPSLTHNRRSGKPLTWRTDWKPAPNWRLELQQ